MQDAINVAEQRRDGFPGSEPHSGQQVAYNARKELEKVEGIPAYPTTAEIAGWQREVRYAVASASAEPELALHHVLQAEKWSGDILDLPKASRKVERWKR